MSESVSLPLNLALTGPTRATIRTWYSLSPLFSIDSQPGTQALSISGSLSASHTAFCGAGTSCSPLLAQAFARLAIQAVRDQQHRGILRERAARPLEVELAQAGADARAARPVLDRLGDLRHRHVDVAVPELARDVGQPRAEDKHGNA